MIYKICPADIWQAAEAEGKFNGAGIDLADGYIHFSTADQVAETAFLHFNQVEDLLLIRVRVADLDLTWEASRGGQLFPHLYSPLPLTVVDAVIPMPVGGDGRHQFPDDIPPINID